MSVEKDGASGDAPAGQSAGNGREVKFGRMLESLIEHGGYSRNRKRISSRLGISSAALSQYIHQQTWPSFAKLLAIADFFDVSLDYLVYGQPRAAASSTTVRSTATSITPWRTFWPGATDIAPSLRAWHGCWRTGSTTSRRTGGDAGRSARRSHARRSATAAERADRHQCDLVSLNLESDVIKAAGDLLPGALLSSFAANLENGARYRFILPQDQPMDAIVDAFRRVLPSKSEVIAYGRSCSIRLTAAPVLAGRVALSG